MAFDNPSDPPEGLFGRVRAFTGRHRSSVRVGIVGVALLAIVAFFMLHTAGQAPVHQAPTITMVVIQPQKPPPPPPPPPQQKMIVQPKMTVPTTKPLTPNQPPKAAPPKPAAAAAPPSTPLGTSIHNNGPADSFNLSGDTGGNGLLGGGGGGGCGSEWCGYAAMVQLRIHDALLRNPITRKAAYTVNVRIWEDSSGTINRVVLESSTGSKEIDNAITNQVLMGMSIGQPPPADMPMPMVANFLEERPGP